MDFAKILHRFGDVKSIALFGLGKSNMQILSAIPKKIRVTLRTDSATQNIPARFRNKVSRIHVGARACDGIDEDMIIFSPSVRRERKELRTAQDRGVIFTSDCELFFECVDAPVFAVSGSDGKSTTATLTSMMLSDSFSDVALCGNIGIPMLGTLGATAHAVELSSFQLYYLRASVTRAAVTTVTPNHLNWHADFSEYRDTKLSLLRRAKECVVCADDPVLCEYLKTDGAYFALDVTRNFREMRNNFNFAHALTLRDGVICRDGEPYVPLSALKMRQIYNVKNFMTALALCDGYIDANKAAEVAANFEGLEHRCERFASLSGTDFINSSIDTSPARATATLSALARRVTVIMGGRAKGVPFDSLYPVLMQYAERVIVYGECREQIAAVCPGECELLRTATLSDAVQASLCYVGECECIILCPGATSYDAYASFEERGRHFKEMIFKHINNAKK